ncbi:Uncharacterised protein [Mycobacteroides abscessus subsp. massiliense]|nr:Uncharacterised protein [Mycobacteroides abscessus subsp. massiliense]
MLCVVAVSSCMIEYIRSMLATVLLSSSACSSICAEFSLLNFAVCRVPAFCAPIRNGIELCSIGAPRGRVIVCTRSIPRMCTMPLATLSMTSMSAGVRRSWSALPRGSKSPNLEATVNTAGANVSAAATITSTEIAHGSAMLWK